MLKEAFEWIVDYAAKADISEINGEMYSDRDLVKLAKPRRKAIEVTTLTGLVDFIKSEFDGQEELLITVDSHNRVSVKTKVNNNQERETIVIAKAQLPQIELNRFIDLENMNIQLQSTFVDNDDRKKVLSLIGNIKNENVQSTGDDGITQTVEVKRGVATIGKEAVPNPVYLKPFRTFTEITQPESAFVLRMRESGGIQVALFEADGGAWKNEAILAIKDYLEIQLFSQKDRITILA